MEARPVSPQSGLYIAWCEWLDHERGPGRLHKVGHTGDLARRLRDDCYTTCFPEEAWCYLATFELPSKEDAFLLETAVLHCCRHHRLGTRELVKLGLGELVALATKAAAVLGLRPTRRDRPVYPFAPARTAPRTAAPPTAPAPAEPAAWRSKRALVEALTVPAPPDWVGAAGAPAPALDLAAVLDDVLALDLEALARALPPRAAPAEAAPRPSLPPAAPCPPVAPRPAPSPPAAVPRLAPPPREPAPDDGDAHLDEAGDPDVLDTVRELAATPYDLLARPIEARPYQREAIDLCLRELRAAGRAVLQMACRCGKTPVAYGVLCALLAEAAAEGRPAAALYLVPGLPLLRQTAQKLASYGFREPVLLVGSDPRAVLLTGGRALDMTTEAAAIRAFLAGGGARLVVCTYQSSPLVPADAFVLTVFDECHRVCGDAAPRPFNHTLLAPPAGARLFMTATPAYDPPAEGVLSMRDRERFGGVAYRYHLQKGIAAGYVNDFRLELVAAPTDPGAAEAQAREDALPGQLLAAMGRVDKLLVFCRDTRQAARLCEALAAAPRPPGVAPFEPLLAHSHQPPGAAAAALRRLAEPGVRAALFNCRMFSEGVEVPALNGVFFAAPRHSPRTVIQCLCRPLNKVDGKPPSLVFIPVLTDPARPPDDPANLKRYATIIPFIDALLDEDARLYEHLLDPEEHPYPVEVLGAHTLGPCSAKTRALLLRAVRLAVRHGGKASSRCERLLRVENLPWAVGFAELRRVVLECNRYPKTVDALTVGDARVCLHRFYRWAADEYIAWRGGGPTKLEPYQVADLQGLPQWERFGVPGPYPVRECLDFLEGWLRDHNGEPPMIEINRGGFVGLDATPMERLAGFCTCINQGDGKERRDKAGNIKPAGSGFTVSADKQAELDRICRPYGLRWRKERDPSGALIKGGPKTFIQEAHARFMVYYKNHGSEGEYIKKWFPFYPRHHSRMEYLEVQENGTAPPRWRAGKKKARRAAK
jgi:superfamily II DNA or RNA helicase